MTEPRITVPARACAECGQLFAATRPDRRFCSSRCRNLAYWRRVVTGKPKSRPDA